MNPYIFVRYQIYAILLALVREAWAGLSNSSSTISQIPLSITSPPTVSTQASLSADAVSFINSFFTTYPANLSSFCSASVASSWLAFPASLPLPPITREPPCCGPCIVNPSWASVYYWPTDTASNHATTFVNTDGFTFTSPSVYADLQTIERFAGCDYAPAMGSGLPAYNTVLAFAPEAVSTVRYRWTSGQFRGPAGTYPIDFGVYATCTPKVSSYLATNYVFGTPGSIFWDSFTYESPGTTTTVIDGVTQLWDVCQPDLAPPTAILSMFPEWSSCLVGAGGIPDPPIALTGQDELIITSSTILSTFLDPTPQATHTIPAITSQQFMVTPSSYTAQFVSSDPLLPVTDNPPTITASPTMTQPLSGNELPTIIVNGQTFTVDNSRMTIGDKTLEPGDPAITVSGTPISLGPTALIVGDSTVSWAAAPTLLLGATSLAENVQGVVTIDGEVITAEASHVIVDGTTVTLGGPAATLNGMTISADSTGLLVDGTGQPWTVLETSTVEPNLASLIMAGLGGTGPNDNPTSTSNTNSVSVLTGSAAMQSRSAFLWFAWAWLFWNLNWTGE